MNKISLEKVLINWVSSPYYSSRKGDNPTVIVLHSTGGSYQGAISWFKSRLNLGKTSAHFVISRDGQITQMVDLEYAAHHAGKSMWLGKNGINTFSIGIELAHMDGNQDWPAAQIKAAAYLCKQLLHRFEIQRIVGHADICLPKGRKIDPYRFPWNEFRTYLAIQKVDGK